MDLNTQPLDLQIPGDQPEREMEAEIAPRPGGPCPRCREGRLEYDRMLVLKCSRCGFTDTGGCFT